MGEASLYEGDKNKDVSSINMGKLLPEIGPKEEEFIASQKVFFVATAPLDAKHHVSVSPKCNGCVVLDPHTVIYGDLTGSGAETAAHVLQNGRMTLMFCNLENGPPKILRLFGQCQVILAKDVPQSLRDRLPMEIVENFGFRAVYKLRVTRVSSSCGYSLPVMEFVKNRKTLDEFFEKQGPKGTFDYQTLNNSFSIDGLPSLALLREDAPEIVPVREDGYVRGKILGGSSHKRKMDLPKFLTTKTMDVRVRDLVASSILIFVTGAVAGWFFAVRPTR